MERAFIIYSQFFDRNGEEIRIGGIETYIYNLCKLFFSIDVTPIVYQFANKEFVRTYHDIKVVGVKAVSKNYKKNSRILAKKIQSIFNDERDIIIFASEEFVVPFRAKKVIAIQHGISWDIPNTAHFFFNYLRNAMRALVEYRRLRKCSHVVCVDYNFLNWYRAVFRKYDSKKFYAIPNFCNVVNVDRKPIFKEQISIIFARRFVEYRGAILFAKVAKRILQTYPGSRICFAGKGPCESQMKAIIGDSSNVLFTSYLAEESITYHSNFDIAVIPTIGSEGTSLSLLEAMAAGCAIVSTNVGGITNLLIDGYNGRIVNATEEEVYSAVEQFIENEQLRKFCIENGKQIAHSAFSEKVWINKWLRLLNTMK